MTEHDKPLDVFSTPDPVLVGEATVHDSLPTLNEMLALHEMDLDEMSERQRYAMNFAITHSRQLCLDTMITHDGIAQMSEATTEEDYARLLKEGKRIFYVSRSKRKKGINPYGH